VAQNKHVLVHKSINTSHIVMGRYEVCMMIPFLLWLLIQECNFIKYVLITWISGSTCSVVHKKPTMMPSSILNKNITNISTYLLITTKCFTYLPTYIVNTYVHYLSNCIYWLLHVSDWLDSSIGPSGLLLVVVSHLLAVPVSVLCVGLEKNN
jgi:hypothetical protein